MTMSKITVLYGTETGNSELLAMDICKEGENLGLECVNYGMEHIESDDFSNIENLLIVCSTWGDGEQPDNAIELFDYVEELDAGELANMKFSVLALGDTAFDLFWEVGKNGIEFLKRKVQEFTIESTVMLITRMTQKSGLKTYSQFFVISTNPVLLNYIQ